MEKEKELMPPEEEEEEEVAEEVSGSLEKRKKRGKMGKENGENVVNGGGEHSVYFETEEGADFNNDTDTSKLLEDDNSVAENNLQAGNSDIEVKGVDNHKIVAAKEENDEVRTAAKENGSSSQFSSVINNKNGNTRNENEIQECKEFKSEESAKLVAEEYDLERIIEEQETHDLYCPNCRSCITKRVILRKRKRTNRESQSDLPPQKVQHVPEATSAPTEAVDHEDETVFRCLSCFSYFIPTESGFNIFRMFGKKDGSNNLHSSEKIHTKKENWVSSLSGSRSTNNKATETATNFSTIGVPLLAEKISIASRDPSSSLIGKSPSVPTTGATDLGAKEKNVGINSKDLLAGESYSNAVKIGISAQENKPTYAAIVSKDPSAEKSYSSGALTGNIEHGDKQSGLSTTVRKEPSVTTSLSNGGLKDSNAQGDQQSYPTKNLSEAPSTGASFNNGTLICNQTQGGKRSFPATTVLEGITTSKENINGSLLPAMGYIPSGNDAIKPVSPIHSASPVRPIQSNQIIHGSETSNAAETVVDLGLQGIESSRRRYDWDILKSIVYGGLIELITSLSLVASAAGAGTSTLHICALGLANLIGGLFLIAHDLSELRNAHDTEAANQRIPQASRYWEKLGKREHFKRHTFFAILSYIIFGLLPPIIYAFTFRKSDNKEHKIIAMASSSLFCIALLAIGKAHVRRQKDYIKSLFYYLAIALPASGLAYVAGVMINRLCLELGLFDPNIISPSPPSLIELLRFGSESTSWQAI